MNYDFVSYRQKYGKTYVTNYVLPHILSRLYPFLLKERALEGDNVAEQLEC